MSKALEAYIEARSARDAQTGCLEWTLSVGSHGYGQGFWRGKNTLAHRLSWLLHRGSLPRKKKVLHSCDNRRCVEFAHLFLGTDLTNCLDKISKNRGGYGARHSAAISEAFKRSGRLSVTYKTARRIFLAKGMQKEIAVRYQTTKAIVHNIRARRSYKIATEGL